MDEYYRAIKCLPEPLFSELNILNGKIAPFIQEIRIRAGQPLQFVVRGRCVPCVKYLPLSEKAGNVTKDELEQYFVTLCRHSVYAYEEELKQGFFTAPGGDRIGVAGIRGPGGFSVVTSLNIRISRWVLCDVPQEILRFLDQPDGGLLISGAPGSGKTTFLRSLILSLCKLDRVCCVIDERGELLGNRFSSATDGYAVNCDVYTHHPKTEAIEMALRCMNPQLIACDEIGTERDADAIEKSLSAGVVFLASVHCNTPAALKSKPQLARLIKTGAFQRAVFLDGREMPGTVSNVVNLQ